MEYAVALISGAVVDPDGHEVSLVSGQSYLMNDKIRSLVKRWPDYFNVVAEVETGPARGKK